MNTENIPAIGAIVNEEQGTVIITANGLEIATIELAREWNRILVRTVATEYRAPGFSTSKRVGGAPTFCSEPTTHEVPETVIDSLAALLGLNID